MTLSSSSIELGPLAALVGTWEGAQGIDVAYANAKGAVIETPYRERATFGPFGPVDNGRQALYGLDYRMSAWRLAEEGDPFHTEVLALGRRRGTGDALLHGPPGVAVLAGASAAAARSRTPRTPSSS